MVYLLVAIGGYICLAAVNIFDKFILSKAVSNPTVFVFYSSAPLLPILFLVPFGTGYLSGFAHYLIAASGGLFFVLALWTMYKGFLLSEVSHAGPLLGAATTFFVLLLSNLFLKENLTQYQLLGVLVLMVGSLIVSVEKSGQHRGWHMGMLWIVASGLLYAVSHIASKYTYDTYGFGAGLVWTRGFMGIFGAVLFLWPSVRRAMVGRQSKTGVQSKPVTSQLGLVFSSRTLAVVAVLLIQYATAIGSVTIVNALAGLQYASLVISVALLTKFAPRLFKEKFDRGELRSELLAVLVIGVGLVLVIF